MPTPLKESKKWCLSFLHKKLSKKKIDAKLQELYDWSRETFPDDGCFTFQWLDQLIRKIDHLWFEDRLIQEVTDTYGGLMLRMDIDEDRIAGFVMESKDRKKVFLHLNRNLFHTLFLAKDSKPVKYHSGGLLCEDRFLCLLHVLLHEIVHLLLTVCDKRGWRDDSDHHGEEFKQIIYNMYRQTDAQHGLIPGMHQYHDLVTIKKRIKTGTRVFIFTSDQWIPAKVLALGDDWVQCHNLKTQKQFKVHPGLIRFEEDHTAHLNNSLHNHNHH